MYAWNPDERDKISAIPIIPILPAKLTKIVLVFFVSKFFKLSERAVIKDIEVLLFPLLVLLSLDAIFFSFSNSSSVIGFGSSTISPSSILIILVEYFSAISGLWVTIMISLSLEISCKSSIIWALVFVSSAPVGSSASKISGSFISARAIATLCI